MYVVRQVGTKNFVLCPLYMHYHYNKDWSCPSIYIKGVHYLECPLLQHIELYLPISMIYALSSGASLSLIIPPNLTSCFPFGLMIKPVVPLYGDLQCSYILVENFTCKQNQISVAQCCQINNLQSSLSLSLSLSLSPSPSPCTISL